MTNHSVVENKITFALKNLEILEGYKKYSREEIEDNIDVRGAIERYLYLAAQASIDACDAFISLKDFRKPTSLREGFEILGEKGVISGDLQKKMIAMTGFRNIIAHGYDKIDYDRVYNVLQNHLNDIKNFVLVIKGAL